MSDQAYTSERVPWHVAYGERFSAWSWETDHVPTALRQLADALEADPDLVLFTFVNGPGEPTEPQLFTVQAIVSSTADTSTNPAEAPEGSVQ